MSGGAAWAGKKQSGASRHAQAHPPGWEELRRQVERQQREIEKLRKRVAERDQQIADAEKQIADAEKQIADLERQLAAHRKNSTNSSKPPSSDGLAGRQGAGARRGRRVDANRARKPGTWDRNGSAWRSRIGPRRSYRRNASSPELPCRKPLRSGRRPGMSSAVRLWTCRK